MKQKENIKKTINSSPSREALRTEIDFKSESGNVLLGILMFSAVAGTLITSSYSRLSIGRDKVANVKVKTERIAARRAIEQSIDCAATLGYNFTTQQINPGICNGGAINLLDYGNNIIGGNTTGTGQLAASTPLSGSWHYKATCSLAAGNRGIRVEIAKANAQGNQFAKYPLSGQPISFKEEIGPGTGTTICDAFFLNSNGCGSNALETKVVVNIQVGNSGIMEPNCQTIDRNRIKDKAVQYEHMDTNAVTNAKLATGAVQSDKIQDGAINRPIVDLNSVSNRVIKAGAINSSKIVDGSVNSNIVLDNAITGPKLANDAIDSRVISDGSVQGGNIASGQISSGKIQAYAVTTTKVMNRSIQTEDIEYLGIENQDIRPNSIGTEHFVDRTIYDYKVALDAVRTNKIADAQINNWHIAPAKIFDRHIRLNNVKERHVQNYTLQLEKLSPAPAGCSDGDTFIYNASLGRWTCGKVNKIQHHRCALGLWSSHTAWNPTYTVNYTSGNQLLPSDANKLYNKVYETNESACMYSVDTQTASSVWDWDWVGCNRNEGWLLAACGLGDSATVYSEFLHNLGSIQADHYATGGVSPPVSIAARFWMDKDISISNKSYGTRTGRVCITNDMSQSFQHMGFTTGYGLTASCIKIDQD